MGRELEIFLDAGIGWRTPTANPSAILLTHAHSDHILALPSLLRCGSADPAVFVPHEHFNGIREMCRMTWGVKGPDGTSRVGKREDVDGLPTRDAGIRIGAEQL